MEDGHKIVNPMSTGEKVGLVSALCMLATARMQDEFGKDMAVFDDREMKNLTSVVGALTKSLMEDSSIPYKLHRGYVGDSVFNQEFHPPLTDEQIKDIFRNS